MAPKATDAVVPKAAEKDDKKVEVGKDGKPLSKKELEAKKKAEEDELSDEDKQLKEELELIVTRLGESSEIIIFSHLHLQASARQTCGARPSPP